MKLEELIKELQESLEKLGNVEVYTHSYFGTLKNVEGLIESNVDNEGEETWKTESTTPIVVIDAD